MLQRLFLAILISFFILSSFSYAAKVNEYLPTDHKYNQVIPAPESSLGFAATIVSENVVWMRELKHPTPNICTFCPDAAANAQRLLSRETKLSSCSSGTEKICNSAA